MAELAQKLHHQLSEELMAQALAAREAGRVIALSEPESRAEAIRRAAASLKERTASLLSANAADVAAANAKGLTGAMIDRLQLNEQRIASMVRAMEEVASQPDPLAESLAAWERPNGLAIARVPVPLGVIAMIYESRPNVTVDAAALCIKSGNAVILRGGSESSRSSEVMVDAVQEGLRESGLPEAAVQKVATTDREAVGILLGMAGLIDVIIPRGGKSLTERVMRESRVPTLLHLDGNCHTYIHVSADPAKAEAVLLNAKMRRTGVCGATESLLIDAAIAPQILPRLVESLLQEGCALRGDPASQALDGRIQPAQEDDWGREYLDAMLSVKTVGGLEQAIAHINRYGSHHTDAILAEDPQAAARFLREVDSAIVMHNTSTQFADGGEFGLGAEIGIATGRLHARGPVGAAELTTYKYLVRGNGQTRP